ncbi:MAG: tape measure protein [Ligilactobacillus agilis]|uniref:tape measure protein n=1 Tax=Ligilactobacillus agilis TaxID=1601 RepID=UPI00242B06AD|nr:tape measure protein [Ligilactobacillus agilis]MCI5762685.1 tape measure protein [Ligilactobacillus agilis]
MAADSTVNIDVVLGGKDKFISDTKEINDIVKIIGKDAGNELEKDLSDNLDKSKDKAKQTHNDIEKEFNTPIKTKFDADDTPLKRKTEEVETKLRKVPKEVITKITADAKEQGIDNFGKLLRKLPKQVRTELLASAQKGEVINYEELLRKVPTKIVTHVKLNDNASVGLRSLRREADETKASFSRLKDIMIGSFAGGLAVSGIQAIKNGLTEATKAGMEYNREQDTMRTVWTALTTQAPEDGKKLVEFINDLSQHSIYAADTINKMAQSFYHVHSNVEETKSWTNSFIALGSTMHMTNEQLAEASEMFAKIEAGGKASAEDLNVMINRFPMFGEAIQEATGKSMKQLLELSAHGKLTADEFTKAIDFLGEKYKSGTEEAMTSFQGMSMFIKSRWQTLWGEVTQTSFNMSKKNLENIRDLLSDDMMKVYAQALSDAFSVVLSSVASVITFIHDNKGEIIAILGNLKQIAIIIGETVWDTFKKVIGEIADALGIAHDKGDDAQSVLSEINGILVKIIEHQEELRTFIKVFMGLFVAKKAWSMVSALTSYYKVLKDIIGLGGLSGLAKGIGVGADKLFGIQRGGQEVAEAVAKSTVEKVGPRTIANGARTAAQVGQRTAVRAAEKGIIARTASRIPMVGSLIAGGTELIGINKNNKNEKVGRAVGATGGTAAGGAAGAWIGGAIGSIVPGAGTAIGAGVGSLVGSTVGGMLGAKGGGSIGKNFTKIKEDTVKVFDELKTSVAKKVADIGKGIASGFEKAVSGISKIFNKIKKPILKVFDSLKKGLQKTAKAIEVVVLAPFVLLTAAIIKIWQKIEKPVMKVVSALEKGISKAWNSISKVTSKVWGGITKTISSVWNGLSKTVSKGVGVVVKVVESAWNGLSKVTGKVWNGIKKAVLDAIQSIWKPLSKTMSKIADIVSDIWNDILRTTRKIWNSIFDKISDTLESIWRTIHGKFDDIKGTISDSLDSIKSKWSRTWNGIKKKVSDIWDDIKGIVHGGVKAIGDFWNTGAHGLEKVAGFFGAKVSIPKFKDGTSGPIARPMLAMVNDQEGPLHREAIFRQNGKVEIPEGRNVLTMLHPGDAIMPAKETAEMFGIPKFAGGFGDWFGKAWNYASSKISKLEDMIDDKIDAITDALKNPLGTLLNIYSRGKNTAKSFWHNFGDSGAKLIPHWGENWFKNLLTKLKDKLDEIGGDAVNGDWSGVVKRALKENGLPTTSAYVKAWLRQIQTESGGNAKAVQTGADPDGDGSGPAMGLLQTKHSTFNSYAFPGHHNIFKGLDNALAAIAYAKSRYGSNMLAVIGHGHGYANGGHVYNKQLAWIAEDGDEFVINNRKPNADSLLASAIKQRAEINPNSFSAKIAHIIDGARTSGVNGYGVTPQVTPTSHTVNSSQSNNASVKVEGDTVISVQLDSDTIARATYPKQKLMQAQEITIAGNGGAIPVV